ncbi:MAG: tetratricopeptide repeat protein, partial [Anaerolineae bacterium]|nr:tetratricopeptide repeat protein [Anaerolineae bacterium]
AKCSRALYVMGITFRQIGDFSSAIDAFSKGLAAARLVKDAFSEMRALNGLASIYGHSHQHSTSLNYLQEALIGASGQFYPTTSHDLWQYVLRI